MNTNSVAIICPKDCKIRYSFKEFLGKHKCECGTTMKEINKYWVKKCHLMSSPPNMKK